MASSVLFSAAPYHIISYGTLLGSSLWQSFIGGTTAYKVLPRAQFASLQQATFPVFFGLQTALPILIALTLPEERTAISTIPGSFTGVFHEVNRWTVLLPLGVNWLTAVANLVYLGPQTTKVMRERKHQETRDGKRGYDAGPHSEEMQRLNRKFGMLHGMSAGINLVGIAGVVWYAFYLGARMT